MKMKAENRAFEPDSWDMCGVLSFDAMTVAQKISYNPRTGSIVGLAWERDQEGIGIVKAEYARAARRAAGVAPDEPEVSGGQLELSKHYNVYYYNSLGRPDFAFPVARYCMGTIETMSLLEQFDEVTMQLALRGFHVSVSATAPARTAPLFAFPQQSRLHIFSMPPRRRSGQKRALT